jgi:exodeoxyribonuclease-3
MNRKNMRLISWNVNGMRSILKKGFADFWDCHQPDIFCAQETRLPKEGIVLKLSGHEQHWNHAQRPGYSGTAVFTKITPLKVTNGIGIVKHDTEGRVMTFEYEDFFLVNVYVPNSKRRLERLAYRSQEWDPDFLKYLKKNEKKKPVIVCGDFNAAHTAIDLANPKRNEHNHGFTPEERAGFDHLVEAGFIDTFREFEKEGGHYTWWSPMGSCRAKNIGWRIDYFLISSSLRGGLKKAFILSEVSGSDHCPVGIEIKL